MAIHWNDGSVTDIGMVLSVGKSHSNLEWGADHTFVSVWDESTQSIVQRIVSSMYGGFGSEQVSTNAKSWEVDASGELQARVEAILSDRRAKAAELRYLERNLEDALEIGKGKRIRVYKGRKVAIGTEGIVKWMGEDNYHTVKVGMLVEGNAKLVYTAASNVVVVLPSEWTPCDMACDAVEY